MNISCITWKIFSLLPLFWKSCEVKAFFASVHYRSWYYTAEVASVTSCYKINTYAIECSSKVNPLLNNSVLCLYYHLPIKNPHCSFILIAFNTNHVMEPCLLIILYLSHAFQFSSAHLILLHHVCVVDDHFRCLLFCNGLLVSFVLLYAVEDDLSICLTVHLVGSLSTAANPFVPVACCRFKMITARIDMGIKYQI